jgi:hypothetical protein
MLRTVQIGAVSAAGAVALVGWALATGPPSTRSTLAGPSLFPVIAAASEPAAGTLRQGGTLTLSGRHAPRAGSIVVLGRWASGRWQTMATTSGGTPGYSVRIPLTRSGLLRLQIRFPDGSTAFETRRVR